MTPETEQKLRDWYNGLSDSLGKEEWDALIRIVNDKEPVPEHRSKSTYVGAPAIFALDTACHEIRKSFNGGCYLVGSALERADWRDVDVRMIMLDEDFAVLFPGAGQHWEQNSRWLLLTTAISDWLSKRTGLPVDYQFQPRTHANERHSGPRHSMGVRIAFEKPDFGNEE